MIKKTILILQLVLISLYSHGQESSIELPLIGDRLSGAVSQTEEEALGRQFLRDNNIDSVPVGDNPLQKLMEELPFDEKTKQLVKN